MFSMCGKYRYPPDYQYYFKQPVDISPYKLNYNKGDTVWMQVHIPGKKLYDTLSKKTIFYDSASITANINVQLVYKNPYIVNGARLANFVYTPNISASESVNQNFTSSSIQFGCSQATDYDLRVGVIFTETGVFTLSLNGSVEKCMNNPYIFYPLIYYFNVADGHVDYYKQLPFADISQQPDFNIIKALNDKSAVCVNVQ
jgi:hypothetical protein